MRSRTVLITLAALAGSASAGAASARLEWKDLDLSTEAGRAELDQRIGVVADRACRSAHTGSRMREAPAPECLAAARAQVETKLAARLPQWKAIAAAGDGTPESR